MLPILLGFIFAAVDINNAFHVYSVLEDSTNQALRCAFTTDGRCVEATAGLESNREVGVWLRESIDPEYYVPIHNYSGSASWLSLPTHTYTGFEAPVIDSLNYNIANHKAYAIKTDYPGSMSLTYWVKVAPMPFITGTATNASFRYKQDTSATYTHDAQINMGFTMRTNSTSSSPSRNSSKITINPVNQRYNSRNNLTGSNTISSNQSASMDCFESATYNKNYSNSHSAGDNISSFKRCGGAATGLDRLAYDEVTTYTNAVLHVTGSAIGMSGNNSTGNVQVQLIQEVPLNSGGKATTTAGQTVLDAAKYLKDGGQSAYRYQTKNGKRLIIHDLGGRALDGTMGKNANFVPRGADLGTSSLKEAAKKTMGYVNYKTVKTYKEFKLYQNVKLFYGAPTYLKFTLNKNTGTQPVVWRASRARFYLPLYKKDTKVLSCGNLTKWEARDKRSCSPTYANLSAKKITAPSISLDKSKPSKSKLELGCTIANYQSGLNLYRRDHQTIRMAQVLKGSEPVQNYIYDPVELNTEGACSPLSVKNKDCPKNTGIAGINSAGTTTNQAAMNVCSPKVVTTDSTSTEYKLLQASGFKATDMSWKVVLDSLDFDKPFKWKQPDCNQVRPSKNELPSEVSSFDNPKLKGHSISYKDFSEDANYIDTDGMEPSTFIETHPKYKCSDTKKSKIKFNDNSSFLSETSHFKGEKTHLGCSWQEILEAEMDKYAHQSGQSLGENEVRFPEEAYREVKGGETSVGRELVSSEVDLDSCVSFNLAGASGARTFLGTFPSDQLLEDCFQDGYTCEQEFSSFNTDYFSPSEIDLNLAASTGEYMFKQMVKNARSNCREDSETPNCLNIEVSGDEGTPINVTSQYMMPLFITGNRISLPIKVSRTRQSELNFAK